MAEESDDGIHLRDLWRVIVKRKWVVISVFLIVMATALVATMMATPIYRATITLKIEREASKVIDFKGGSVMPEESGDLDFYRTQYELLKSRSLAERVVEELNLRPRTVAKPQGSDALVVRLSPACYPRQRQGRHGSAIGGPRSIRQPQRCGRRVSGRADRGADSQFAPGPGAL